MALEPSVRATARDETGQSRLSQQLVTLISFTALPGISGTNFRIERDGDEPDYSITKITVSGRHVLILPDYAFDLHLEGGVGYSETDEKSFGFEEISNSTVAIKTDRKIYSGHFSVGPSLPLLEGLRVAPQFQLAISRFDNKSGIGELVDSDDNATIEDLLTLDWTLWAITYAGSLGAYYDRQFDAGRLEIDATYTHAETDVVDAPSNKLKISGSNDLFTGFARWTQPTGLRLMNQPLYWNVFVAGTLLAGDGREALGFGYYGELGAGLDLDLRDKEYPLVEAIRLKASGIYGDDVSGWQVGVGFRF